MDTSGDKAPLMIAEGPVPDFYTDSVGFEANVYGMTLRIAKASPGESAEDKIFARLLARIHMSPQHAKVMAILFQRNVDAYESQVGEIVLPDNLRSQLAIQES